MSIHQWPSQERPREKLIAKGSQSLSDAELLAVLLGSGTHGKTAVDLARGMLNKFGSLQAVLESSWQDCQTVSGIGLAKDTQLQAVLELGQRYLFSHAKQQTVLANTEATQRYLIASLGGYQQEVFACVFLDTQYRIINFEKLFFGSINMTSVHPREIVKRALANNATAVILAHNHPSGVAEPSLQDRQTTADLQRALELIDMQVLDHVVVGRSHCVSFAERGWLGQETAVKQGAAA